MKSTPDGLNPFCSSRLKRQDGTCAAIIAVRETSGWRFGMRTACRSIPAGGFSPVLSRLTGSFSGRPFPSFYQLFQRRVAVRRLVLEFSDLVMPFSQLSLFTWEKKTSSKERNLQKVLDSIRMKFGKGIIAWGKIA